MPARADLLPDHLRAPDLRDIIGASRASSADPATGAGPDPRPLPDPIAVGGDDIAERFGRASRCAWAARRPTAWRSAAPAELRDDRCIDCAGAARPARTPAAAGGLEGVANVGSRRRDAEATATEARRCPPRRTASLNAIDLKGLDLRHYIGPFKRCYTRFVPQWVPIVDVPDITFRVLQDIDGDGDEELIYGEGYFQVRWNAGPSAGHDRGRSERPRRLCAAPTRSRAGTSPRS